MINDQPDDTYQVPEGNAQRSDAFYSSTPITNQYFDPGEVTSPLTEARRRWIRKLLEPVE
jgi:hypothetical protein